MSLEDIVAPQNITEDVNVDPESDPVYFISILVESLAMLKRMPEAIDVRVASDECLCFVLCFVFSRDWL